MKTFAIGDIHGMHDKLMMALSEIEAASHSPCRIVFLGDYIDRGPDSKAVIDVLMKGPRREGDEWICLKGNHEQMMVDCIAGRSPLPWWLGNGGAQTMESYDGHVPDEVLAWCGGLPVKYETDTHFFVHAGIDPRKPLAEQNEEAMLWIRDVFLDSDADHGKHIVHGHTPSRAPELWANRTNLDIGAFFYGKLAIGLFDGPGGPKRVITV